MKKTIVVNGEPRTVAEDTTIAGLLEALELRHEMIVVERNRDIVPREAYPDTTLDEGDTLELVHFVGGG